MRRKPPAPSTTAASTTMTAVFDESPSDPSSAVPAAVDDAGADELVELVELGGVVVAPVVLGAFVATAVAGAS